MAEELEPCPFCGQSDFLIEQLDGCSSVVICQGMVDEHSACLARGPISIQDDDGEEQPGKDAAIREWNTRAQLPSQGGEAVEVPRVLGLDHPHCPRNPLIADGFRCGADWMRRQVLALGPLYTHPPTTPADSRVVLVELLERIAKPFEPGVSSSDHVVAVRELRALLEAKP